MVLDMKRADHITAKVFFDNLIVVYCGCFLKFGFIPNIDKQSKLKDNGDDETPLLKDIELKLNKNVEITKILETCLKNNL